MFKVEINVRNKKRI